MRFETPTHMGASKNFVVPTIFLSSLISSAGLAIVFVGFGLQTTAFMFAVCTALICLLVARNIQGNISCCSGQPAWLQVALFAPFAALEGVQIIRESNEGGFAVQLASLGGEDSSAWMLIAGTFHWQDVWPHWQGYGVVALLSLTSGLMRPLTFLHGQEFGTIGFSTLVVHGSYSALVLAIPAILVLVHRRLQGNALILRWAVLGGIGFALFEFVSGAREMGHLTAALAGVSLAAVLVLYGSLETESANDTGSEKLLLLGLCGVSFLWLPFAPIGVLSFVVLLHRFILRVRFPLNGLSFAIAGISLPLLSFLISRGSILSIREMFQAPGGTLEAKRLLVGACGVAFALVLGLTSRTRHLVGLKIVFLSLLIVLLGDSVWNEAPGYGARKVLWVSVAALFPAVVTELAVLSRARASLYSQRGIAFAIAMLLIMSGSPQVFVRTAVSPRASGGGNGVVTEAGVQWDQGYLGAQRGLEKIPVSCVVFDPVSERFVPGWEGYECSRLLSWSAPPGSCASEQLCPGLFVPEMYESIRFFGIGGLSFSSLISSIEPRGVDVRRTILVLDQDGRVLEELRIADFVRRVVR